MGDINNRDLWHFSNYSKFMLEDKKYLIDYYINTALMKTLKMFEYDGLPDTIPVRELERILQLGRFAYWLKAKDGELYVFYGGLGGLPNEYYQPTNFIVANPYLKFFATVEVNKEGVLMWNDYAHMGLYPIIRRYAEFMAECDITLRFGLINARIVAILEAINDKQKAEAELYLKDVVEGKKLGVIVGKSFETDDGSLRVNEYRRANTQDIKDVIELQQYIKASFYNEIGLQANFNMKREAINGEEAGMNEEALKPLCDDLLQCRKDALELINKQFGLNVSVRFSSSWEARKQLGEENAKTPNEETTEEVKTEEVEEGGTEE